MKEELKGLLLELLESFCFWLGKVLKTTSLSCQWLDKYLTAFLNGLTDLVDKMETVNV